MELTEEQRERIKRNRERALEIQRKRREQKEEQQRAAKEERVVKRAKVGEHQPEDKTVDLEEFEIGASELVTKHEAKTKYCLPDGTLEVCSFVEKQNPRNKGWTAMKLYNRSEIRRRARERFGGKEGLIAERKRRQDKRFLKDMEDAKKLFKK